MCELRDEIGFNFEFETIFGTQGQDKFNGWHGNALRSFYKHFTPESVASKLTKKINNNPQILCLALEWLQKNIPENYKNKEKLYLKGKEDGFDFSTGITEDFVILFLKSIDLLNEN